MISHGTFRKTYQQASGWNENNKVLTERFTEGKGRGKNRPSTEVENPGAVATCASYEENVVFK